MQFHNTSPNLIINTYPAAKIVFSCGRRNSKNSLVNPSRLRGNACFRNNKLFAEAATARAGIEGCKTTKSCLNTKLEDAGKIIDT